MIDIDKLQDVLEEHYTEIPWRYLPPVPQHLRDLATGHEYVGDLYKGICYELSEEYDIPYELTQYLSMEWPECADDTGEFPVPHPHLSPRDAYSCESSVWANDPYGDARRRLCAFLADRFEELISYESS